MDTAVECFAKADECDRQARHARSAGAREALLEVAAAWRRIGNDLQRREQNGA
jgi:hypothetical protein